MTPVSSHFHSTPPISPLHPLTFVSTLRPNVRAVDVIGVSGVELERVVHPGALGLPLPDPGQYLLLAADRLPV